MADENQLRDLINQINRENEEKKRGERARYIPEEYRESEEDRFRRELEGRYGKKSIENMPQRRRGDSKTPYMQKMPYRRDSDGGPYIKKL